MKSFGYAQTFIVIEPRKKMTVFLTAICGSNLARTCCPVGTAVITSGVRVTSGQPHILPRFVLSIFGDAASHVFSRAGRKQLVFDLELR